MKNTKLNYSELKISNIASSLGRELNVEIMELEKEPEGGKVLCLVNGHFNCAVDYINEVCHGEEPESFNGLNDKTTYESFEWTEIDVNNATFRHLKGHSVPVHSDIICWKIENEIKSYLQNEKNEQN